MQLEAHNLISQQGGRCGKCKANIWGGLTAASNSHYMAGTVLYQLNLYDHDMQVLCWSQPVTDGLPTNEQSFWAES